MTTRYQQPDDVRHLETDPGADEWPSAYLAVLPAGPIHWLDPMGYLIWSAAVDLWDAADVIAEVASLSGEPPDRIQADVNTFLDDLVGMGLLRDRRSS